MENLIHSQRDLLHRSRIQVSWGPLWRPGPLAGAALLLLWTFLSPNLLHAQAAAQQGAQPTKPAAHATAANRAKAHAAGNRAAHRRATVHRAALQAAKPAAGVPATPPAPPKPNWPAELPPHPAKVAWDSHGLAIEASNSSLDQILHDVATDTGVKLEGLNQDERIFGNYGPGPAREVLSRLLEGSGYNVMMIGGQGDEPPQRIILSKSTAGSPQPANPRSSNTDEEGETDDQSQPQGENLPMPPRNPFGDGAPNRTPQEIQQEMLMREQQIQQQRYQQQENPQ